MAQHIEAADGDAALETHQAQHAADDRRLAGAIPAPERHRFPRCHAERDAIHGGGPPESLGEVIYADHVAAPIAVVRDARRGHGRRGIAAARTKAPIPRSAAPTEASARVSVEACAVAIVTGAIRGHS